MAVRTVDIEELVNVEPYADFENDVEFDVIPEHLAPIRIPENGRVSQYLTNHDPFQLAAPCWMVRVFYQLPPETYVDYAAEKRYQTRKDKETIMAIRTVEATAAPARLFKRGGISSKQDYIDLLAALNTAKPNQAFIVDMDPKDWVDDKGAPMAKPEVTFANSLRRRFETGGLAITAYMSGKNQITVRRLTALEIKEREAGKGKRGRKSNK